MLEAPDGTRLLIAPSGEVARFVASVYRFDAVAVGPVEVIRRPGRVDVLAGELRATMTVGRRGLLGLLLRPFRAQWPPPRPGRLSWTRWPG